MELVWVDRSGIASVIDSNWAQPFGYPALSPDGRTLAIDLAEPSGERNVWLKPLDGAAATKLTFGGWDNRPAWEPGGGSVAFTRSPLPNQTPHTVRVDGTGEQALRVPHEVGRIGELTYSPNGEWLAYSLTADAPNPDSESPWIKTDLFAWHIDSDSTIPLVVEDYHARSPVISPDGQWFAYRSNRTGVWEIYVRPFPNGEGGEQIVSLGGGTSPRWAHSGREIFYLGADRMMWAVDVIPGGSFTVGERHALFPWVPYQWSEVHQIYDVAPDDQRFLMLTNTLLSRGGDLVMVQNWFQELREKVANR